MTRHIWFGIWGLIAMILGGCSNEEECPGFDPFCRREAKASLKVNPSKSLMVGQELIGDASDSTYDELIWSWNGEAVSRCKNHEECVFQAENAGTFTLSVKAKVKSVGIQGVTGNPASKDSESATITVTAPRVAVFTCTPGAINSTYSGVMLALEGEECLMMQQSDRSACRSAAYLECPTMAQAQSVCDGGVTSGSQWYLPNDEELGRMYLYKGTGTPISTQGFCNNNAGVCSPTINDRPAYYWSRSLAGPFNRRIDMAAGTIFNGSLGDRGSVRCVRRINIYTP